ncbi:hypothetical protein AS850_12010 [Frondihabitans sp. 762G35]|uniref:DUF6518 family protein n=1 Tax=Frondihabitans sp. 762G35 TaxID=1446794 RepID=UPI000D21CB5D|nr:DUF6518 family protein [Frondihabitans sp. 762G35]ARC57798.1 hypothetical protein AS850_12010 [Frondihabitans sp. 762G35]
MTAIPTKTTTPRWYSETPRGALRAIVVVLVGSALIGGLTSPAQQYLPEAVRSLANSAGGWSMFAFLLVWASRARPLLGAVLGAVSFLLMVEAYGVVSLWRGFFFAEPFSSSWTPIALVAGPVFGLAAAFVRHSDHRWLRVAGVAVLSLALVAEAAFGLTVVRDTTSPVYWLLELAAAIAFVALALLRPRP